MVASDVRDPVLIQLFFLRATAVPAGTAESAY